MTSETTISIALLFSVVAVIAQVSSIWSNHRKAETDKESDRIEIEKNFVKLNMKLDQLTETMQRRLVDDDKLGKDLEEIKATVIKLNQNTSTLFHYKDDHEERIKQLESR